MNLQHFHITVGRNKRAPRLSFPVMAPDADTAHAQAMDLAESADERVEVQPTFCQSQKGITPQPCLSDGTWSPAWSATFRRETRALGHCSECFERHGEHLEDCSRHPSQQHDDSEEA